MLKTKHTLKKLACAIGVSTILISLPIVAQAWEPQKPVEFVDSRAHPSVQLADILASTAVYCYSNGLPEGMEATGEILDAGMLRDSIFPDFERVKLENSEVMVHYAVLYELAATAEGRGTGAPIEVYYEMAEQGVASGELSFG